MKRVIDENVKDDHRENIIIRSRDSPSDKLYAINHNLLIDHVLQYTINIHKSIVSKANFLSLSLLCSLVSCVVAGPPPPTLDPTLF